MLGQKGMNIFFQETKGAAFGGVGEFVWWTSLQKKFVLLHCIIVVFQFKWTDIDIHVTNLGE